MIMVLKQHKRRKKNRENTNLRLFCPSPFLELASNGMEILEILGDLKPLCPPPNTVLVGKWHSATPSRRSRRGKKIIIFGFDFTTTYPRILVLLSF